jgi:hypothetical protein
MTARARRVAVAVLAAGMTTAGCAGTGDDGAAPGAVSPAAATGPAAAEEAVTGAVTEGMATSADLRDRLLPAAAFGEEATVLSLGLEQLGSGLAGMVPGGLPEDATVEPPLCGTALAGLPGAGPDGTGGGDGDGSTPAIAAQVAVGGQAGALQVLAESPRIEGAQLPVGQLLAACSTVTVTGADGSVSTIELADLPVPDLGDASAGLQVTVTSGDQAVSGLVGVVVDGPRGLLLAQGGGPGAPAPDPGAFTALLTDASEAAAG